MNKSYSSKKSVTRSQHSFSVAESGVTRERSTFDRPSRTTTALDGGMLVPIIVDEVLPGDTFQFKCHLKGWLATPIVPFLDNLYLDTFFFFVPNRLVWENWQKFQGEKDDPGDTTTYSIPQISVLGGTISGAGRLADYFGIPLQVDSYEVSALPHRGYNLIWNEFFRDQNLQDSLPRDRGDANSTEADHVIKKRGRRKDYLSGCLPWPQRGDTVEIPLGTSAPVVSTGDPFLWDTVGNADTDEEVWSSNSADDVDMNNNMSASGPFHWGSDTGLETDLTSATAATVNQLRESVAIQHLLELDARGGSRYTEQLKARFGVTSADARLQRPEYLGGGSVNISVTPVPNTSGAASGDVGSLGGFGAAEGAVGGFTHSFTEHGYIIGLVNLRADYTYFEGVPRHWNRETRYDFYEPSLARLGEQPVYNREIFVSNNDTTDGQVFGYQERFSEYKYGNSMVTNIIRPNHGLPLDHWTLAQEFGSTPTLGDVWIQDAPPIDRVVAVEDQPDLVLDCYFSNRCTRVMPVFNTPGLTRL